MSLSLPMCAVSFHQNFNVDPTYFKYWNVNLNQNHGLVWIKTQHCINVTILSGDLSTDSEKHQGQLHKHSLYVKN